jgi:hypothetical protein
MGGRIPKSAQRAINKANAQRAASVLIQAAQVANISTPRMMQLGVTPRSIMNMHEVFFNGEKQLLCTYANVGEGKIIRWNRGIGNRPAKGAVLEEVYGKVEIRRRVL